MDYRAYIKKQAGPIPTQEEQEHIENVGAPNVFIEPAFQSALQQAVDFVKQQYPDLLQDVTDIAGHIDTGEHLFGRFQTSQPHTIFVDIHKIEEEVRRQLGNVPEEQIREEVQNQIVMTIVHESTHKKEHDMAGYSSEGGPEAAEEGARDRLEDYPISVRDRRGLERRSSRLGDFAEKKAWKGMIKVYDIINQFKQVRNLKKYVQVADRVANRIIESIDRLDFLKEDDKREMEKMAQTLDALSTHGYTSKEKFDNDFNHIFKKMYTLADRLGIWIGGTNSET